MMQNEKIENIYENVRKILDLFPLGAPKKKEIIEFLKEVFTEEEAKIFPKIPRMPSSATSDEISTKTNYSLDKMRLVLEKMARKGVISSLIGENGSEAFMAVPLMPGILEYVFAEGPDNDKKRRLASILKKAASSYTVGDPNI